MKPAGDGPPFPTGDRRTKRRSARSKRSIRVRLYAAMLGYDIVALVVAFALADLVRFGLLYEPSGANIAKVLLPCYLAIAISGEVYSSMILRRWRKAAADALVALGVATLTVLFIAFYLHASVAISRAVFTLATLLAALLLVGGRALIAAVGRRLLGTAPYAELLILDDHAIEPEPGVTAIDARAAGLAPDPGDPQALDRLGRLLQSVDRVVVACGEPHRAAWAAALKGASVEGEIVTPELAALGSLGADQFCGKPTLVVSIGPLDLRNRALKRGFDLALSGLILVFLAPLLLLIGLAVRLDSPGPVFFVQPRLGRGNRLFSMVKFRSMRADLCDVDGTVSTGRTDMRITRVGRLIRATSLDELPQILNVLRGEMSIVGPRPHALSSLAGDKLFWQVDQRYWHRHAAKPGITGLAQVRGFRGATHEQSDLVDRLQADLEYLNGWTLTRDIAILFRTLRVVVHRNAY